MTEIKLARPGLRKGEETGRNNLRSNCENINTDPI
jgi:hypothetical protein